jgi:hypothetical protein
MSWDLKMIFSGLAIILTFVAFVPYVRSILQGQTKPHVFSWIIWGTTTLIVFLAQLEAHGGVGAWPIGISGAITILIAVLAFIKRTDISIKPIDWVFFLAALASIPIWFVTSDPLWAVVVLTLVDLLGFGPTIRKAYSSPHQENLPFFLLFLIRNLLVILALESYSVTTVLFPASVALACLALVLMVSYRKTVLSA